MKIVTNKNGAKLPKKYGNMHRNVCGNPRLSMVTYSIKAQDTPKSSIDNSE